MWNERVCVHSDQIMMLKEEKKKVRQLIGVKAINFQCKQRSN